MGIIELDSRKLCVFSGTSNVTLAKSICKELNLSLGPIVLDRFSDGEIRVEINISVRGKDVFIIQSTSPPVNENLLELLIMVDAVKRASAKRIIIVVPYFGYARQDRKSTLRVPISSRLVANFLFTAGVDHIITMDIHSDQIQGFFNFPIDNITALPVLFKGIKAALGDENLVIVSPDVGGIKRSTLFSEYFDSDLVVVDKRRFSPNKAVAKNLLGDVVGKSVLIYDDIVDTAGTLVETVNIVVNKGAKDVYIACTHPVLSGPAFDRIGRLPIKCFFVTDTIKLSSKFLTSNKIVVLSVAEIIADAMCKLILV